MFLNGKNFYPCAWNADAVFIDDPAGQQHRLRGRRENSRHHDTADKPDHPHPNVSF
jgi:hypothetical protein